MSSDNEYDDYGDDDDEIEIRVCTMSCNDCKIDFKVETKIHRGYADWEDVECPICEKKVGELRCDIGRPHIFDIRKRMDDGKKIVLNKK